MKNYLLVLLSICFGYVYSYHVTSSYITPIADFDALKQKVIAHPETLVTTTHTLSHQARAIKTPAALQSWIASNEPACPIALLSECTGTACKLSRLDGNSHKRNTFDNYAATQVATTKTATGVVQYVSFAAGGGFTDLRILTLAQQQGLKTVVIHLIDVSYDSCITKLKTYASHDIISATTTSSSYRAQSIKEFISYVTHLFGAGNVQVHIYGSGQDYLNTVKVLGAYAADIIIGIDFDPLKKIYTPCIKDFIKIIETGSAQALHLHGNGIFHIAPKALALSLGLQPDPQKNRYGKNLINTSLLF